MAPKIERAPAAMTSFAIRRKDAAEDPTDNGRQQKRREKENDEQASDRQIDRDTLDKAVQDMRLSAQVAQNGIRIEVIENPDGTVQVRMINAFGSTIRSISALEFIELRDASSGDAQFRGKILDQKY